MNSPLAPVLVALGAAALVGAAGAKWPRWSGHGAFVGALAVTALLGRGLADGGGSFEAVWLPQWDWSVRLRLDALGGLYALLAAGIALPVLAYSIAYLPPHLRRERQPPVRQAGFYGWMVLFLAAMVGLTLAEDLVLLFAFFDLTALCSWRLIAFDREKKEARGAAFTALLVTLIPSLGFLVGIVLLQGRYGTLDVRELTTAATPDAVTVTALSLVLVAALAKSAQAPLHFWLPRAMVAPTPVSAYLHSAAMVAAGVFVLHRLHPLIPEVVTTALATAGWVSIAVGGVLALAATRLKRILAYSTVAQYGHVAVALGLGGAKGAAAAAVYVAVHAAAKSCLFLAAGAVERATGKDELSELGGLARRLPAVAAASAVAAAALMGLPLTAGFFKDEGLFQVLSASGPATAVAGVIAIGLTVAYVWRFWSGIFLGRRRGDAEAIPALLTFPTVLLALVLLIGGAAGNVLGTLGEEAAGAVHPRPPTLELAYHLDLRTTNQMVLAGWLLGLGLVVTGRLWSDRLGTAAAFAGRFGPDRLWTLTLRGMEAASDRLHSLEVRSLRDRLAGILVPAGLLVALALGAGGDAMRLRLGGPPWGEPRLTLALLAAAAATCVAVITRSHLGMVVLLSGVGFSLATVFGLLGAPDVALVAVLVETALTLLFVVALSGLPKSRLQRDERLGGPPYRPFWQIGGAAAAALAAGAVTWSGLSNPAGTTVAARHVVLAPAAHAKNVVAGILTDFRGLDTLGEITVLVVAAVGLVFLLRTGEQS